MFYSKNYSDVSTYKPRSKARGLIDLVHLVQSFESCYLTPRSSLFQIKKSFFYEKMLPGTTGSNSFTTKILAIAVWEWQRSSDMILSTDVAYHIRFAKEPSHAY